jgi:hypothetical protein
VLTQFKNFALAYDGTISLNFESVVACPVGERMMLLSLDVCNVHTAGITCDIVLFDKSANAGAGETYYLGKQLPVPVGSTLQVIVKQKHVLEEEDEIRIRASVQNSVNVVGASMKLSLS